MGQSIALDVLLLGQNDSPNVAGRRGETAGEDREEDLATLLANHVSSDLSAQLSIK